ncbi:MAG: hypothetical protein IJS74_02775 [Clostridia bacterium]|nr:hypothetical protein [Clostridia bacterium]
MQNIFFNLLLAQTELEKKLTLLYVSLFVFLLLLLIIDSRESKIWMTNKTINKIVLFVLIVAAIALVVLYFVL